VGGRNNTFDAGRKDTTHGPPLTPDAVYFNLALVEEISSSFPKSKERLIKTVEIFVHQLPN
jgi:hypothetical protein